MKIDEIIRRELDAYHCAGGHTRAAQAQHTLESVGFRFEWPAIFWPDGERLTYTRGEINYRD